MPKFLCGLDGSMPMKCFKGELSKVRGNRVKKYSFAAVHSFRAAAGEVAQWLRTLAEDAGSDPRFCPSQPPTASVPRDSWHSLMASAGTRPIHFVFVYV